MGKAKFALTLLSSFIWLSNCASTVQKPKVSDSEPSLLAENQIHDTNPEQSPAESVLVPNISKSVAEKLLDNYGFNVTIDNEPFAMRMDIDKQFSMADKLRAYQKYYGLPQSGKLDNATKVMLGTARCGVGDFASFGMTKWRKSNLTYFIRNFPAGISSDEVKTLMRTAFDEWSKVTNLNFTQVVQWQSDIEIVFGSKYHQDRRSTCSFPFADQTLAHATFPEGGTIHFNTRFYFGSSGKREFLTTAMHEIGHALGLEHSPSWSSLMFPSMISLHSKIPSFDAQKIQALYGTKRAAVKPPVKSDFCTLTKVDAILYDSALELHVIAGSNYFRMFQNGSTPTARPLSEKWPGLPDKIDAAFTRKNTFFFRRDKVWAFDRNKLNPGYPRPIDSAFPGFPDNMDAIFELGDAIYALKGKSYWMYDPCQKKVKMKGKISAFGAPSDVEAAVYDKKQRIVFILKDKYFYKYQHSPRTSKVKCTWFDC